MSGWEPAECDVEEREIRREKEADVLRDAGAQRADGHAQGFYLLCYCPAQRLLAAAACQATSAAAAALNFCHASLFCARCRRNHKTCS